MRILHQPKRNLVGMVFGRLKVVKYAGKAKDYHNRWECICDCGTVLSVTQSSLICGKQKSCGCLGRIVTTLRNTTHGLCKTDPKLYVCWSNILKRCYDPSNRGYKNYGDRGIGMCKEWKDDVMEFANWAYSTGYTHKLTIDRIDNDKDYSPENCKWATKKEQGQNRRTNNLVTYKGETLCLTAMAEKYGVSVERVRSRISIGWNIERAMEEPVHRRYQHAD